MRNPTPIQLIDTCFLGESDVIGVYLIESNDGLILIETGPETVAERLQEGIRRHGHDWRSVKHVLLTHIHFDHAGGAWKFAEQGAQIYVHPKGLPHLHDPTKLWSSAKRIYGDDMERLWGTMEPIDEEQLTPLDDGDELSIGGIDFSVHYTSGHAVHHNSYQLGDRLFVGDVAGVKIHGGPVVPPCPPPDVNVEAWKDSIRRLRRLKPAGLYLAHYGIVDTPSEHFDALEAMLDDWAAFIKTHYDAGTDKDELVPLFVEYTQEQLRTAGVSDEDIARYEKGNPSYMSVTGLLRYWKLKDEGRL